MSFSACIVACLWHHLHIPTSDQWDFKKGKAAATQLWVRRDKSHEKIWCIFMIWGIKCIWCLLLILKKKKRKINMRLNIFYHLQSVWINLACTLSIDRFIFVRTGCSQRNLSCLISSTDTNNSHVSGFGLSCSTLSSLQPVWLRRREPRTRTTSGFTLSLRPPRKSPFICQHTFPY